MAVCWSWRTLNWSLSRSRRRCPRAWCRSHLFELGDEPSVAVSAWPGWRRSFSARSRSASCCSAAVAGMTAASIAARSCRASTCPCCRPGRRSRPVRGPRRGRARGGSRRRGGRRPGWGRPSRPRAGRGGAGGFDVHAALALAAPDPGAVGIAAAAGPAGGARVADVAALRGRSAWAASHSVQVGQGGVRVARRPRSSTRGAGAGPCVRPCAWWGRCWGPAEHDPPGVLGVVQDGVDRGRAPRAAVRGARAPLGQAAESDARHGQALVRSPFVKSGDPGPRSGSGTSRARVAPMDGFHRVGVGACGRRCSRRGSCRC